MRRPYGLLVEITCQTIMFDLIVLDMTEFDVIIGMHWLSNFFSYLL